MQLPEGRLAVPTGLISGTVAATADTGGPYSVTITASDGTNTATQSFTWSVNPVVALGSIGDQSNAVGDAVNLPASATDAPNHTLSYSATGLPRGALVV